MSSRWGFAKRMGRISFDDFINFASQFCETVDFCYDSPSVTTITFYTQIPYRNTPGFGFWFNPGELDFQIEANKKLELSKVVGLENVSKELFDRAVYVKLVIRPKDSDRAPSFTFGHLECKGLRTQHLVFYVHPIEVGDPVKSLFLNQQRPSRMKFRVCSGYEKCDQLV